MSSTAKNILTKFEISADPMLIADGNGALTWTNEAARAIFGSRGPLTALDQVFEPRDAARVLSCDNFVCFEADFRALFGFAVKFAAAVKTLGPGDPREASFLITLQPFDPRRLGADPDYTLASIAHDLKNPLGAVFGYADALLDTELGAGLNERQREILRRVRSTAVRSIELVRNLQHLSSLRGEEIPRGSKEIDLNQITQAVIEGTWRDGADGPKVKLELAAKPLLTNVERILIDRVLTNLYGNALKFTPRGGSITVKTYEKTDGVVFEITNNLPLIPKEELSKIFQNRYRGSASGSTAGTGLGLYIAEQIMYKVGGELSAESSEKSGTTFRAVFPLKPAR